MLSNAGIGNYPSPLKILIEASNGASDYGNKIGEPIIMGFCRSFRGDYIENNQTIVATMDKELKSKIKEFGSSILSIHNDKIILEN